MIRAAVLPFLVCCFGLAQVRSAGAAPAIGDPFGPGQDSPALLTPQWVGEEGVEAVVILSIDDMSDSARYEAFLRPVIDRLKKIDGRAPLSIMTCNVEAGDRQVQSWLSEGLSFEVHTPGHPCPLLQGGDFAKAVEEVHGGIDILHRIPNSVPVAFRMPCCDAMSSPSPRFYSEIFAHPTPDGRRLAIDSSVFTVITKADKSLPREIVFDPDGGERFRKYLPQSAAADEAAPEGRRSLANFATWIPNYPYPYVINESQWEVPCMAPSDFEGFNLRGACHPLTVEDWKLALDAVVLKKGVFTLVFHPHGWIRADQVIELIDHADSRYGRRIRFLNFREVHERLTANVSADDRRRVTFPRPVPDRPLPDGIRLTDDAGRDAGVRFADLNGDGALDLVYSNPSGSGVYLFEPGDTAGGSWRKLWSQTRRSPDDETGNLPLIVRPDGSDNGAWFLHGAMWVQNEFTSSFPDKVRRLPWSTLLHPPSPAEEGGKAGDSGE